MRCPYCQSPVMKQATECPVCHLTFPRTNLLVGSVPRLNPSIADTTGHLNSKHFLKIKKRVINIENRFPQLVLQVVMHQFVEAHPFTMHAFWLLNAGQFAGSAHRGKDNHTLLFVIDPFRKESAIALGYGLEQYMKDEALNHLLDLAAPSWKRGLWEQGILIVLDGLDAWLESIAVRESAMTRTGSEDWF